LRAKVRESAKVSINRRLRFFVLARYTALRSGAARPQVVVLRGGPSPTLLRLRVGRRYVIGDQQNKSV
jgi:hypothetical protein